MSDSVFNAVLGPVRAQTLPKSINIKRSHLAGASLAASSWMLGASSLSCAPEHFEGATTASALQSVYLSELASRNWNVFVGSVTANFTACFSDSSFINVPLGHPAARSFANDHPDFDIGSFFRVLHEVESAFPDVQVTASRYRDSETDEDFLLLEVASQRIELEEVARREQEMYDRIEAEPEEFAALRQMVISLG